MKASKKQETTVFNPIRVELVFETQEEFDVFKKTIGNTSISKYETTKENKNLFHSLILTLYKCL